MVCAELFSSIEAVLDEESSPSEKIIEITMTIAAPVPICLFLLTALNSPIVLNEA